MCSTAARLSFLRVLHLRGANSHIVSAFNSGAKYSLVNNHYSLAHIVEDAVQTRAIQINDVYAMATVADATAENLQRCGLTKAGAAMFIAQRKAHLTGQHRLYKEVADYLSRSSSSSSSSPETTAH